jgi:hypothetical protein
VRRMVINKVVCADSARTTKCFCID